MLQLKNVNKRYFIENRKQLTALSNISLEIPNTGLILINGKSGAGKSTLLNLIGGLDKPDSGEIFLDNKDLTKLNEKELTSYRNSSVGFIFQDFNLFDDMTVYENITLFKPDSENQLNEVLSYLGIEDLKSQKVNQLSGGQKQRVAIARALLKNPSIILADEPTGALDDENSIQIFRLLKEISKTTLVIVVSHNINIAEKFADRIIYLAKGHVTHDEILAFNNNFNSIFKFKLNIISFKTIFIFAKHNLLNNKKRLIISSLIISLSLLFFMITFMINNYDITKAHIKTMITENANTIRFYSNAGYPLSVEEINQIKSNLSNPLIIGKTYYKNGMPLQFELPNIIGNSNTQAYYYKQFLFPCFYELNDEIKNNINLIGNISKEKDGILISQYFADLIIESGIIDEEKNIFKPENYNELLSVNKYLTLGDAKVKITGIVKQNTKKYDKLKTVPVGDKQTEILYNLFIGEINTNFYVTKEFHNYIIQFTNDASGINRGEILITDFNEKIPALIYKFNEPVQTNNGIINELNENEIIVSNNFYKYFENNNLIGKIINISINGEPKSFIIRGITKDKVYLSANYLSNYGDSKEFIINSVFVYENNLKNLENIFKYYPISKAKILSETQFSGIISDFNKSLEIAAQICKYVSIVFIIFSGIVMLNYIENSIYYHRKKIAILKCLGIQTKDINKIFLLQLLIVGTISIFVTLILSYFVMLISNLIISKTLLFYFHPIEISWISILLTFIVIYLICILDVNLILKRLNKFQPIEVFRKY